MTNYVASLFVDPSSTAKYLGETVGTHYSAALRATEAYAKHLAARRESLLRETYSGDGLGNFWKDLMRSEQVRIGTPEVFKSLSTNPSHYFSDFLDTADEVFQGRYEGSRPSQKKKSGKAEHAQCLRLLRDHNAGGLQDYFAVQNKVAVWMQLLRVMGGYQS
jgi:hypothetical protein